MKKKRTIEYVMPLVYLHFLRNSSFGEVKEIKRMNNRVTPSIFVLFIFLLVSCK